MLARFHQSITYVYQSLYQVFMVKMGFMNDDGLFVCILLDSSKGAPKCVLEKNVYMCKYDHSMLHDNIYCKFMKKP